jgi:large subunit ribosomal protein L6
MSRIGKLPIALDKGVKASFADGVLKVEGPKGKLELRLPSGFSLEMKDSKIVVNRPGDSRRDRAMHGLCRKLVSNLTTGVSKGFTRVLEINGVGYRAELKGKDTIQFALGYSHPIVYQLPPGVSAKIDRQTMITLEGADRQLLGQVAAQVRALRPPEPYKGKGIKYATEFIKRKAGKAAAGATAT